MGHTILCCLWFKCYNILYINFTFNVQEQIEDPFDNEGLDDVMLDMYKLDY